MKYIEQKIQDDEYNLPYHYIPKLQKNTFSDYYRWSYSKEYISFLNYLLERVKPYNKIVEVGCGDGRIIGDIKKKYSSKECIGIDYSEKSILLAKALSKNVSFKNINITSSNNINNIELILLIEVFEHIPIEECEKFVIGLSKMQSSNGVLFLTVPHKNVPLSKKHFQHFDVDLLNHYFKEHYTIEEIIYLHSKSNFFDFIERFFYNSLYSLTNERILYQYYNFWKKHNFYAKEKNASRIFLKLIRK